MAVECFDVRYAKREELESVNKIRKQVNEVHVKGRPDVFREDGWQVIEPLVYKRFDEESSGVIVAAIEEEIVGFAVVQYIVRPESPFKKEQKFFHIEEFGVDENHRRKGIATALINFAKADAKERAAIAAMQGLLAKPQLFYDNGEEKRIIEAMAMSHADELVRRLKGE